MTAGTTRAGTTDQKPEQKGALGRRALATGVLLALSLTCGCGKSASQEPTTPSDEDKPVAQTPSSEASADDGASVEPTGAADGSPAATPEDPIAVAERLCKVLCKEVESSCTARAAQFCQASCPDWTDAAKACPIEVEEALTCQTGADRYLLCANVATATCAPLYRTLSECREGKRPPKKEKGAPPASGVPAGYVKHTLPALGGYFLLPEGPLAEQTETRVTASRPPHTYVIERIADVPTKELTDRTVLQIASAYVGNPCVSKLSLKGRFEKGDLTYIRFASTCKDGTSLAGMFLLQKGAGVAASVRAPAGQALPADLDTYIYGFEPTVAPPARNNDVEE